MVPGGEIASMSQSFTRSGLNGMSGGFKGGVCPSDGIPMLVPSLTFRSTTRIEWPGRKRGQSDGAVRKNVVAEPNGFHLPEIRGELRVFRMTELSQPRFSPFIDHPNLDLAHLCIYIPHCPHGDNKCDANDAILEDLILGR